MSTRTKSPSRTRTQSMIGLDPEEFEAPGLDEDARSAGAERSELAPEVVDDAVNRARVRSAVGPLADGGRISDEVIDELGAEGTTGSARDAGRLAGFAPEGIVQWVLPRLGALGRMPSGWRLRLRCSARALRYLTPRCSPPFTLRRRCGCRCVGGGARLGGGAWVCVRASARRCGGGRWAGAGEAGGGACARGAFVG